MEIKIVDVSIIFNGIKTLENIQAVKIEKLAKELKVSKFELLQFIKDNPKLFYTENLFKEKRVRQPASIMYGTKIKAYYTTQKSPLGLFVSQVYLFPNQNYRTQEWLETKLKYEEKYLEIKEYDNYGYISGYYIPIDFYHEDDVFRKHIWRNSESKVEKVKNLLKLDKKASYMYGGLGDSGTCNPAGWEITLEQINKLKSLGWTFNNYKPLSK